MTLRFGLLGTGPWARHTHGPALAAHPGVELVGVWGRRPEAAAEVAAQLSGQPGGQSGGQPGTRSGTRSGTRAYADPYALIADVDAVAIALPPYLQAQFAARAAKAGRRLLLDKPLAVTVGEARAVADAVAEASVPSVVFFTLRFDTATAEWIDRQAATGDWYTGRADWYGAVFGTGAGAHAVAAPGAQASAAPDWRTNAAPNPYANSPWRREKGGLWDVGPHALSVLLPVLGDVTDVHAARGPGDTVHLTLRHDSGASSTAALTLTAPPAGAGIAIEFRGTHGVTAYPDNLRGPVTDSLAHAIDALLAGTPHPCDARFGLRVTEILAAAEAALG